jgi:hypothetical protein
VIQERIAFLESPKDKLILRFRTFENSECYGDLKTEIIKGQLIPNQHPLLKEQESVWETRKPLTALEQAYEERDGDK